MKNNIEVEIRAILKKGQKEELIKKLGIPNSEERIIDVYFCRKEIKNFKDIEMNDVGSYSLRLRKAEKSNSEIEIQMNTKIITQKGDHNSWEEHEVEVDSLEESITILESIGFKPYFKLDKIRKSYSIKEHSMIFNIDIIKKFGTTIEVEIITNKENSDNSKVQIKNYLKTLGILEDQIVPKSITNILMHRMSKF
ncbi:MAG: CYTH domain-containing protein [Patescibacteria group bacterium]